MKQPVDSLTLSQYTTVLFDLVLSVFFTINMDSKHKFTQYQEHAMGNFSESQSEHVTKDTLYKLYTR